MSKSKYAIGYTCSVRHAMTSSSPASVTRLMVSRPI